MTPTIANWRPSMRAWIDVHDTITNSTRVVAKANLPLQSPTWAPDGTTLLTSANGSLYRIGIDDPSPALKHMHIKGLHSLGNDRGFSPDGSRLAITDKSLSGKSAIYIVAKNQPAGRPVTGPRSWFHGWSPDGRKIVYSCLRNGLWSIATCTLQDATEHLLIQSVPGGKHLYDGPEFTPDGRWIWFNSNRSGQMALWRMQSGGGDAEQMTSGESADWFPHPSPDGRQICYLSYPPGTRGHPFGRHVKIRTIPENGGTPRTLCRIFGGHGTLNAPCWAPDGRRFAYVRYTQCEGHPEAPRLVNAVREIPAPPTRPEHAMSLSRPGACMKVP